MFKDLLSVEGCFYLVLKTVRQMLSLSLSQSLLLSFVYALSDNSFINSLIIKLLTRENFHSFTIFTTLII